MIKTRILCAILLICCISVQAGKKPPVYPRFRVLLADGEQITGERGVFQNDTLVGVSKIGTKLAIPVSDIRVMSRYIGNEANIGGLVGGGIGLAVGYVVCREAEHDAEKSLIGNANSVVPIMLGCTAGGVILGALIGVSIDKWEEVQVPKPLIFISPNCGKIVFTMTF